MNFRDRASGRGTRRGFTAIAAAIVLANLGCNSILGFEDDYYVDSAGASDPCTGRCPTDPVRWKGPSLVDLGDSGDPGSAQDYCIDSTEVTVGQYTVFLDSGEGLSHVPQGACAAAAATDELILVPMEGGTYYPAADAGPVPKDLPITGVAFCAAHAYCGWSGKRLCGAVGSGPSDFDALSSVRSQWFNACSVRGTFVYPYGATYDQTACVTNAMEAAEVGTTPGCQGPSVPFSCIHDLGGNAREWEDACNDGTTPLCRLRGGDFRAKSGTDCKNSGYASLITQSNITSVGFRCCYDLPDPG